MTSQAEWLDFRTTLEEYVEPTYYDELLQPYVFTGGSDLDLLEVALAELGARRPVRSVLELGVGTGRVTEVLQRIPTLERYRGIDLSGQMIEWSRRCFADDPRMSFVQSDSLDHLDHYVDSDDQYDLIVSLWSFSHSVHQHFRDAGGEAAARRTVENAIAKVVSAGGSLYLIHFDALSDEQRILVRQWNRVLPIFEPERQSPSKEMLDAVVADAVAGGRASARVEHLAGVPIRYESLDRALETFMNFHLEGFFNDRGDLPEVLSEVREHLAGFQTADGSVLVAPGAFQYVVTPAG